MNEEEEFTGCLACLNDGYSRKINYLIASLVVCLIAMGAVIVAKASLMLGLPLIVLALLFGASWFAFDYLNKREEGAQERQEVTTADKKNE